jgi:hypothetical protein
MTVYILQIIKADRVKYDGPFFTLETVGVYSSEEIALEAIKELPIETDDCVYDIQDFELDASAKDFMDEIQSDLKNMMDMGVVDQLIGEDGQFYYELTDAGKEMGENLTRREEEEEEEDEEDDQGW